MQSRHLAGWRGGLLAGVIVALLVTTGASASVKPTVAQPTSGGVGLADREESAEIQRVTFFPRTTYSWPFASGPHYGGASSDMRPGVLHTMVGSFDLTSGRLAIPAELTTPDQVDLLGLQYFVLQVHPDMDTEIESLLTSIADNGGAVLREMPVSAFLVRLTPAAKAAVASHGSVIGLIPYQAAFKLSPMIGQAPLLDPFKAVSDVYELDVIMHKGEDANAVAAAITGLGANVLGVAPDALHVEVNRSQLVGLAKMQAVYQVFEHVPTILYAEETTTTMQTGRWNLGATPYHDAGVTGAGQILMVLDTGFQLDAGDLSDTKANAGSPGVSHRKVIVHQATNAFGGLGDLLGCDASTSGAFTHGHTVSATALGWGTEVDSAYDPGSVGWVATDPNGNTWKLDGVAPEAKLVAYDAQETPATTSCGDPAADGLIVGNIYSGKGSTSSLDEAYRIHGARVNNFSWGTQRNPVYGTNAGRVDDYMNDRRYGLVVLSAGNDGRDDDDNLIPDANTVNEPATCKNCLSIGATRNANDTGAGGSAASPNGRAFFSSVGPVPGAGTTPRIQPILMAPGSDTGSMGIPSEYSCRTSDNNQTNPVQCSSVQGISGTSFSAPAAAGAALLVRDYFEGGFYPDGTAANPGNSGDQVAKVSGALIKAVLAASADWVGVGNAVPVNSVLNYRFNREQGYGRIQLDNALPLQGWGASPAGLIVVDGDSDPDDPNGNPASDLSLAGSIADNVTQAATFDLCDTTQELRVALAWTEPSGQNLTRDLNLELQSPTGKIYYGNYFTDDDDKDGTLETGEDCPSFDGTTGILDGSPWSLPTCGNSDRDNANPIEGIFLTPDLDQNGEAGPTQLESGTWTIRIRTDGGSTYAGFQPYAVAIAGGVCLQSSVRFDRSPVVCNDSIAVTVNEKDETGDPAAGLTVGEISSRVTVEVLVGGVVVDSETGIAFTKPDPNTLRYVSADLVLSDGLAPDPGNGALDVQDGAVLRVKYQDENTGGGNPGDLLRVSTADTSCSVFVGFGDLVFGKFGQDTPTNVDGGCELNARGKFEFGLPDQYVDAGETVDLAIAFFNNEAVDLENAQASLRCVLVDGDSPEGCLPGSTGCADPNRTNNPACANLTVLDSPKSLGTVPAGVAIAAHFLVRGETALSGSPEVEFILGVSSVAAGKSTEGLAISRTRLNVDEVSLYYSTDFPSGGTENRDYNNDERLGQGGDPAVPITNINDFFLDYRFEQRVWSSLTATGKNLGLNSPWNFNANDGGFRNGIGAESSGDIGLNLITNWGEDLNFNGVLDAGEDVEAPVGTLNKNWGTSGGCGWQTGQGVWHSGTIGTAGGACDDADCEKNDVFTSAQGTKNRFELLLTPVIEKVNGDSYTVEFLNWAWNMSAEIGDPFTLLTWEFDTDADNSIPVDLIADLGIFNSMGGPFGPIDASSNPGLGRPNIFGADASGFPLFARLNSTRTGSINGTVGTNRTGDNSCWFEQGTIDALTPLGVVGPPDDDIDNDSDATTDEFVTANGPVRNYDITTFNGPDMRLDTLEDIYGPSGQTFQGALGFYLDEDNNATTDPNARAEFGVAIDDMVVEWREFRLDTDTTTCTGECAVISLSNTNFFDGSTVLALKVIEKSPQAANDCNLDGTTDATQDCDGNGVTDVVLEVFADLRTDREIVFLNREGTTPVYSGSVSVSVNFDVDNAAWNSGNKTAYSPGTLFLQRNGTDAPSINAEYLDNNDGTGKKCPNDVDPAGEGIVRTTRSILVPAGTVTVKSFRLTDNGDNDGYADTNETVNLFVTLQNNSGVDLEDVVVRLSTNDAKIECISNTLVTIASLPEGTSAETPSAFVFKVANVNRTGTAFDPYSADLNLSVSTDLFDTLIAPQKVSLDLDLDVTPGAGTSQPFIEGFEASATNFGKFTSMTLDVTPRGSNAASNGYRCQYNNPDFINSNSYGSTECYLGLPLPQNRFDWHVHTLTAVDGGRSFGGNNSLHMGVHQGTTPVEDTTRFAQLDAVRMTDAVHLTKTPGTLLELRFKHQIALIDDLTVNAPVGETPDRAVVMVQLSNLNVATGNWIKISPYKNVYDRQGTDNFFECMFDPVDDGDNEDSFFDPSDPDRRLGPSATCFPEFVFANAGDTDSRNPFNAANIGRASDGPGLDGNVGNGTWVETAFSLDRFRGRSLRVRFLFTSIQVFPFVDLITDLFALPAYWPFDDGWYIDDVEVTGTLSAGNTVTVDTKTPPAAGTTCTNNCSSITAALTSDAVGNSTPAPGHVVTLDASATTANACINGTLQYQFWDNANLNGVIGDAGDILLRDWTDNPLYVDAPEKTTVYAVKARCSSAPACAGSNTAVLSITVNCPSSGGFLTASFSNKTTINWGSAILADVLRGNLNTLRSGQSFVGALQTCLGNDAVPASSVTDNTTPTVGNGLFYLVKREGTPGGACNAPSWSSFGTRERPGRDAEIGNYCP